VIKQNVNNVRTSDGLGKNEKKSQAANKER